MTEPPSLDGALRRLHAAVTALEKAAPAAMPGDAAPAALRAANDRADRLDSANREAAHRIDHAMETIRSVLDTADRSADAG